MPRRPLRPARWRDRLSALLHEVAERIAHHDAPVLVTAPVDLPEEDGGPPAHWVERVRRSAPGLLERSAQSFGRGPAPEADAGATGPAPWPSDAEHTLAPAPPAPSIPGPDPTATPEHLHLRFRGRMARPLRVSRQGFDEVVGGAAAAEDSGGAIDASRPGAGDPTLLESPLPTLRFRGRLARPQRADRPRDPGDPPPLDGTEAPRDRETTISGVSLDTSPRGLERGWERVGEGEGTADSVHRATSRAVIRAPRWLDGVRADPVPPTDAPSMVPVTVAAGRFTADDLRRERWPALPTRRPDALLPAVPARARNPRQAARVVAEQEAC